MDTVFGAAVRDCHVAVFTGGSQVPPSRVKPAISDVRVVIAADSGLHLAVAWDTKVHHVVGDMDSVDPSVLARARTAGATISTHPEAKDHTDLELALDEALRLGATKITVLGGAGGRLDHLFGTAFVLTAQRFAAVEMRAFLGASTLTVIRREATLTGPVGELVGLFALHGPARGVRTVGLEYPLDGEALSPASSRGVSNRLVADSASVAVDDGVVLCVQTGMIHK